MKVSVCPHRDPPPSLLTSSEVTHLILNDLNHFLFAQLSEEGRKKKRRSLEEEVKEKREEQREKTLPVLHLQGQKKKSYTLVHPRPFLSPSSDISAVLQPSTGGALRNFTHILIQSKKALLDRHREILCVCVCVWVRVCSGFCYLFRTFAGMNTDCVRTSSPRGEQRALLMWHDLISEVLVQVRVKAWTGLG